MLKPQSTAHLSQLLILQLGLKCPKVEAIGDVQRATDKGSADHPTETIQPSQKRGDQATKYLCRN